MKNLCCGFLLLMTSVAPAVAETVDVNPSATQVAPGDSFTVHLDHTGFPTIGAGTVGIEWNPAVLRLDGIAPPRLPT